MTASEIERADAPRIVLVGTESTGKTTLSRQLLEHYRGRGGVWERTAWVPEYGREYTELLLREQGRTGRGGEVVSAEWGADDFARIAREQQRLEDAAAASGAPLVICDTDALATRVWERRYLGAGSHAARDAVPQDPPRALYLLCSHEGVPFEADAIRDGEHLREAMTDWFVEELTAAGYGWRTLVGDEAARLAAAVALVDEAVGAHA